MLVACLVVARARALIVPSRPTARATPVASTTTLINDEGASTTTYETSGLPGFRDSRSWLNNWYPVTFSAAVPDDKPTGFAIFERPLVLFKDADGAVRCLEDTCPHRLAPLSDGRLTRDSTGRTVVECSYHGWQFEGKCGACVALPQLEERKSLNEARGRYDARAYPVEERQGIVFVWLGEDAADPATVPIVPEFEQPGWIYEQDYVRDLPYDWTTLVENIIDPSHVPVSHHGTTQGDRASAAPLEMSVAARGEGGMGFEGETAVPLHGSARLGIAQVKRVRQRVEFLAPSRVGYYFSVGAGDACALFYPIPTRRGHSRVLVRRGRNFATERRMGPAQLVAKHLENNVRRARREKRARARAFLTSARASGIYDAQVVFDQDMAFLRGQESRLQSNRADGFGSSWRTDYVMPTDADRFVINYRKQLDTAGAAMPWRSPPDAAAASAAALPRTALLDRYHQHTVHCATCSAALALVERLIARSRAVAIAAAFAALTQLALLPAGGAGAAATRDVFAALCALGAASYSTGLVRAYVVGPVVGGLRNSVAAAPGVSGAVAILASAALRAVFGARHASSARTAFAFVVPAVTGACALVAARALEQLKARFIFTEEAKALQDSP